MATVRIKNITTTATSPSGDDFVAIDGATAGTRKIDAGPLGGVFDENITTTGQIQVAGGAVSAPSYAFSGDPSTGMSRPTANAVNLVAGGSEVVRVTSAGVGIGGSSTYPLTVSKTGDNVKVDITNTVNANFRIGTSGSAAQIGPSTSSSLELQTGGTTRWTINPTGNLVAGSGLGIDFSATSDGSGSGQAEILDDWETGQWSPQLYSSGGSLTATMDVRSARYVKVGHKVTVMCYIRTSNVDNSSATGSLRISGLPYAVAGSDNYTAVSVGYAINWSTSPAGGYTETGQSNIILTRWSALGENLSASSPADLTNGSGTNNEVMLTATYCSF